MTSVSDHVPSPLTIDNLFFSSSTFPQLPSSQRSDLFPPVSPQGYISPLLESIDVSVSLSSLNKPFLTCLSTLQRPTHTSVSTESNTNCSKTPARRKEVIWTPKGLTASHFWKMCWERTEESEHDDRSFPVLHPVIMTIYKFRTKLILSDTNNFF